MTLLFLPFNTRSHLALIIYPTLFPVDDFLPFDIMSHSAFLTFDIIFSQHFLLFDILSRWAFITLILLSFRRYWPFDVLSFRRFLLFDVFSVNLLSHSTFGPSTFCPIRCLVRRHFFTVGVFYFDILSVNPYFQAQRVFKKIKNCLELIHYIKIS